MKEKIYCQDLNRKINKKDCYHLKLNPNCRTCSFQKTKPSHSKKRKILPKITEDQLTKKNLREHIYTQYPPEGKYLREEIRELPGHVHELDLPNWETIFLLIARESSFQKTKNPIYVLEAFLIADQAGLYPPDWALSWLLKGFKKYHKALGKMSIEKTLGFAKKGQGGRTPPFKEVLLEQGDEPLMYDIFQLHKFGKYSVRLASKMVAKRLEDTKDYDQTGWGFKKKNADSLEKKYHQKWKSIFETMPKEALKIVQGNFQKYQEEFMNQFIDPKSLSERRSI